jgi:hypothetical protein
MGRDLALRERPVREVPQGPLTGNRLVDAGSGHPVQAHRAVQRRVGRDHQATFDGQLAAFEQRHRLIDRKLARGREVGRLVGRHDPDVGR